MHDFIARPLSLGSFDQPIEGMFCASAESGSLEEGNWFNLQILVDLSDGVIADVKYRFFGPTILLAILEATSRYLIRKNVLQAAKISLEILDRFLSDADGAQGLEEKHTPYGMFVLDGVYQAIQSVPAVDIGDYSTPLEGMTFGGQTQTQVDWMSLDDMQRRGVLEVAFEEHIRPFLAIDEGGVEILRIEDDLKIVISYSGSCTSCYSAIGGTLQGIQNLLRERVYKDLVVVPDMETLKLF